MAKRASLWVALASVLILTTNAAAAGLVGIAESILDEEGKLVNLSVSNQSDTAVLCYGITLKCESFFTSRPSWNSARSTWPSVFSDIIISAKATYDITSETPNEWLTSPPSPTDFLNSSVYREISAIIDAQTGGDKNESRRLWGKLTPEIDTFDIEPFKDAVGRALEAGGMTPADGDLAMATAQLVDSMGASSRGAVLELMLQRGEEMNNSIAALFTTDFRVADPMLGELGDWGMNPIMPGEIDTSSFYQTLDGLQSPFFAIAVALDEQGHIDPSLDLELIVFEGEATHVVPAPGAAALVLLGSGLVGFSRRRRARRT